ncbi:GtrA family protein [Leucobacter iarius]|uniref:GtrA/DPMS transmembrane domain-containing protein n=1 Tax=Leucobacter iarius TaxID=333963 RepID=A0ABN2LJ42_9MICO
MLDHPRRRTDGLRTLVRQLLQFAVVGGFGFVVDVGLFNLLRAHPPTGLADQWPIIAKCISVLAAIAVNWMGNRWWTFRSSRRRNTAREAVEFLIASLVGSGVSLLCLWVSHYVLDLRSVLADNISANFIGLALGSAVRFAAYRWWVFAEHRIAAEDRVQ